MKQENIREQEPSSEECFEYRENEIGKTFQASAVVHGFLYATTYDRQFIKIDLKSGETHLIYDVKNRDLLNSFYFQHMIHMNGKLYMFSATYATIIAFDLKSNNCSTVTKMQEILDQKPSRYLAVEKYGESIFVFPRFYDEILLIEENAISPLNYEIYREVREKTVFCLCGGENMYFFPLSPNVYIFNMIEKSFFVREVPVDISSCKSGFYTSGYIYLLTSEGFTYKWNINSNHVKKINTGTPKKQNEFGRIIVAGDRIWLMPGLGDNICYLSSRGQRKTLNYPKGFCFLSSKENLITKYKFYEYCSDQDNYYFSMRSGSHILCIDQKSGEACWIKVYSPPLEEQLLYALNTYGFVQEKEGFLPAFLNLDYKKSIMKKD